MKTPDSVRAMMRKPGMYRIDMDSARYFYAHVDGNGEVRQMSFDSVLTPDRWNYAPMSIRGPLDEESPLVLLKGKDS